MKDSFKLFVSLAITVTAFLSCSKEKENQEKRTVTADAIGFSMRTIYGRFSGVGATFMLDGNSVPFSLTSVLN